MPAPSYLCATEGAVALAAATAKTICGVKAHANSGLVLLGYRCSFDGVTATAVPVLVELCYTTWATNSPGTNSTSTTPQQRNGRPLTAGFTSGKTWTAEPTVLSVRGEEELIPAFMGGIVYDFPLGTELDTALAEGFAIRCTAPAIVNVRGSLIVARC